jgi:hypothetical protein
MCVTNLAMLPEHARDENLFQAVRFDTRLERIKHFSQVDKPMTIRAACDREADSTFDESSSQSPLFEWAIVRPAEGTLRFFPLASAKRGFLSSDYKYCSCTSHEHHSASK